ncbi:methyl-accepting chemotaxis protein, partial [Aurantimonas marianensis]
MKLSDTKISFRIGIIAAICISGMLALVAIFAVNQKISGDYADAIDVAQEAAHVTDRIEIDFLQARRAEKDFFLRKDPKYIEKHAAVRDRIAEDFGHLTEAFATGHFSGLAEHVNTMKADFAEYHTTFNQSVETNIALGLDPNSGLQGALRAAVHDLEEKLKAIGNADLQVMMLMLRRHEKDFILRQDPKYIERLQKQASELAQVDFLGFGSPEAKAAVVADLETYMTHFAAFAEATLAEMELRTSLSAIFAHVEPSFAAVKDTVEAERSSADAAREEASQLALYIVMGLATLLTLIIGGVVFLVGRSIAAPIGITATAMRAFAAGDMTAELPQAGRKDEIGDMVKALLAFRESEEQKRAMVAERQEADRLGIEQRSEAEKQAAEAARLSFIANVKPAFAALSEGDLTARLDRATMTGFEEICDLSNDSVSALEETVGSVVTSIGSIRSGLQEINTASNDLAQRTEQQAANLEETV